MHHLLDDIDRLTLRQSVPSVHERQRGLSNERSWFFHVSLVEQRLRNTAVSEPEISVCGQEAVSKETFEVLVEAAANIVSLVILQHVLDILGVRQCVSQERSQSITG